MTSLPAKFEITRLILNVHEKGEMASLLANWDCPIKYSKFIEKEKMTLSLEKRFGDFSTVLIRCL
jgi:hypothetical protein